jgi:peptidoglycan/LPS O-acetylase OafA/YrhL
MSKLSLNSNHIPVLDSLRGLAAISVCIYHFVVGPINFVKDENVLNVFSYGKYGVQLFFVISGFIIPWSLHNKKYENNIVHITPIVTTENTPKEVVTW